MPIKKTVNRIKHEKIPKLFIVLPVFNDWLSLEKLTREISQLKLSFRINYLVIDDCSTEDQSEIQKAIEDNCSSSDIGIEVLKLAINRGNQFAIWVGLNYLHGQINELDRILVMDSDGEDDPLAIPNLLANHSFGIPTVAKRGNRTNRISFKIWHLIYKKIFQYFTGKSLDFGNFSVIDNHVLARLLADERSNYMGYVGGLLSVNHQINRIKIDRGPRFFGESKTNVHRLIQWGLLQISPFTDSIFSQALKLSVKFTGFCLSASVIFLFLRIFQISVIPGWTSLIVSLALAISFLLMILTAMFLTIYFLLNGVRIELKASSLNQHEYSTRVRKFLNGGNEYE